MSKITWLDQAHKQIEDAAPLYKQIYADNCLQFIINSGGFEVNT